MIERLLYKYRKWEPYGKRMLEENEFYFTSPRDLNDPFDCYIDPEFGRATRGEKLERLRQHLASKHPELDVSEIAKLALKQYRPGGVFPGQRDKKKWLASTFERRDNFYGILSLSWTPIDVLMWTHYADQHKGICVGLSVDKIDTFINARVLDGRRTFFYRHPIEYVEERPIWNFLKDDTLEMLEKSFVTKSSAWSYEQEERVFITVDPKMEPFLPLSENDRKVCLLKGTIREVWLGLNAPKETEKEVKQILKGLNSEIVLRKADRERRKFSLTGKQI